jgi:archaeal flagellar protein FlaJ
MVLFTKEFGKAFIFKKIRPGIRSFFMKSGYDDVPYEMFGWLFYVSLLITYFSYIIYVYPKINDFPPLTVLFGTFISWVGIQITVLALIIIFIYFNLVIKIYKRTKDIESILPDYLQVVSANLKGGLSFEKSLWNAIRPEFGVIAKEITMVSKKVMTGNDLAEALQEFTEKYESPLLRRSFDLIIGEVESGGEIAYIVDKVIDNIRKTKALKEEMSAQTLSYMIFIGAIVIIIAPGLFALSFYLLNIMDGFSTKLSEINAPGMPITFTAHAINISDFKTFSILALVVISFFSALLLSIIEKGDVRGGIKYIPMFIISSLVLYFLFMYILSMIFGQIQI